MKKKKTPLDFAQQLEEFQTTRKAKEVNEIYNFDRLKESLKQRLMTLNRRMETLHQRALRQRTERPEIAEEYIIREKAQTLQELAEFDQQVYDAQLGANDSAFDTIAEIQGFCYQDHSDPGQTLKQLPEASTDAFAHELDALTKRELQKELEQNEKALQESLQKPERLELSSELPVKEPVKEPSLQAASSQAKKHEEPVLQEFILEADSEAQEKTMQEDVPEQQEKKKSESSLIYFRSSPPPSEKGS